MHILLVPTPILDWPRVLLLGGGFAVVVLILLAGRILRRRNPASNHRSPSLPQKQSVERDMQALMRELSEMVRRAGGQFDDRANRLEQLIREADARIRQLQSIREHAPAKLSQPRLVDDLATGASEDAAAETMAESTVQTGDEPDSRHADIYELHAQGLTPHQIADRLGRSRGEIELIIALRPRGREAV